MIKMYLDNAASTRVSNEVENKLNTVLNIYGNPSSQHDEGFKAKEIINSATRTISKIINFNEDEIYYTSGATMSNNLIIQGFMRANPTGVVLYSAVEHNDIVLMADYFKDRMIEIPVNHYGSVLLHEFNKLLSKYDKVPVLVSIQAANGEVGTIQCMNNLSLLVHAYPDSWLHSDVTQYIPFYKLDFNPDAISMSGQKIGCIKGTGLMAIKKGLKIDPIIFGEQGLVGGTENTLGIACLEEAFKNINIDFLDLKRKRDYFIENLDFELVGNHKRLPNNISVLIPNVKAEEFVELLNGFNIYISAGSACSSGSLEPSHVLKAMGYSDKEAKSCIRITINNDITYEEIDDVVKIIKGLKELNG